MNAITTKLSSKGQLVLPKALRDKLKWAPGTELLIEHMPGGVLVKKAPAFPPSTLDKVAGALKHDGPPLTLDDMDRAITEEVMARHARRRY